MLALAFILAAQLPPPPAERVTEEVARVLQFGDSADGRARAEEFFDDRYNLKPGAPLDRFDLEYVTTVDRPADLEVKAAPLFKKGEGGARMCVVAIAVN